MILFILFPMFFVKICISDSSKFFCLKKFIQDGSFLKIFQELFVLFFFPFLHFLWICNYFKRSLRNGPRRICGLLFSNLLCVICNFSHETNNIIWKLTWIEKLNEGGWLQFKWSCNMSDTKENYTNKQNV